MSAHLTPHCSSCTRPLSDIERRNCRRKSESAITTHSPQSHVIRWRKLRGYGRRYWLVLWPMSDTRLGWEGWCRHLNVSTSVFGVNTAVPSLGLGPTPGNIDCIFVNRHIGKRGNPLLGIILSSPPSWTRQADKISDVLSVVVSNTKYFLLISCKTHQSSWILEPSPS